MAWIHISRESERKRLNMRWIFLRVKEMIFYYWQDPSITKKRTFTVWFVFVLGLIKDRDSWNTIFTNGIFNFNIEFSGSHFKRLFEKTSSICSLEWEENEILPRIPWEKFFYPYCKWCPYCCNYVSPPNSMISSISTNKPAKIFSL